METNHSVLQLAQQNSLELDMKADKFYEAFYLGKFSFYSDLFI